MAPRSARVCRTEKKYVQLSLESVKTLKIFLSETGKASKEICLLQNKIYWGGSVNLKVHSDV